jgi:hypothetical protein
MRYVGFLPVGSGSTNVTGHSPDRCACGHLEEMGTLPPGKLFGSDPVKRYHPFNRPN